MEFVTQLILYAVVPCASAFWESKLNPFLDCTVYEPIVRYREQSFLQTNTEHHDLELHHQLEKSFSYKDCKLDRHQIVLS